MQKLSALQTPRSVKKEKEEVIQVLKQIPLQPAVKTMVTQAVPLQPTEVHGRADVHPAADGGPLARAGGCTQRRL